MTDLLHFDWALYRSGSVSGSAFFRIHRDCPPLRRGCKPYIVGSPVESMVKRTAPTFGVFSAPPIGCTAGDSGGYNFWGGRHRHDWASNQRAKRVSIDKTCGRARG